MKPLPGSTKSPARDSLVVGDVDPEHPMMVTIVLKAKQDLDLATHAAGGEADMSREEYASRYGALQSDVAHVEAFAAANHLSVAEVNLAARTVVLAGRTGDMQKAFSVHLKMYATKDDKRFRGREGEVFIPDELEGIVVAVFGLDDRPVAKPHFRELVGAGHAPMLALKAKPEAAESSATAQPFNAPAVAKLYQFPSHLDGSGECIAIIELGGGYRMSDLNAYFQGLGLATPSVVSVGVHGARNSPGHYGDDGEVALDIEVAGSIAPKAKIAVYFTPNTNAGFLLGVNAAVHDALRKPSVISISWGGPEVDWTEAAFREFEAAFQAAASMGITVLVAAGDDGSSDGVKDGKPHVDFPASTPTAVACGGTRLVASSATAIASETVWNEGPSGHGASGGGVSDFFAKPSYQASVAVPESSTGFAGRGSPDVSGNADPVTGYNIFVHNQPHVMGGTSAVAPLYAGLTALLNQAGAPKKVGFLQPKLYAAHGICRDVTQTNNDFDGTLGVYNAGAGWDPASGFGSAIGTHWLATFISASLHAHPTPHPAPRARPNP